jgi:hypothetical protein
MACAGIFYLLQAAAAPRTPYPPGLVDERFAELKRSLPKDSPPVGYLGDIALETNPSGYYLTQYALAPVVVAAGAHRHLVVGNFARPALAPTLAAANGLVVLHSFGNGVFLFREGK